MSKKKIVEKVWTPEPNRHHTSIGSSSLSKPKNKHKRRSWKRYRGQGR